MLPDHAWKPWEPRFGLPIFKGVRLLLSFSVNPEYSPLKTSGIPLMLMGAMRNGFRGVRDLVVEHGTLLRTPHLGRRLEFRFIITTREGEFLGQRGVPGSYPPGGSIDIEVADVLAKMGLPDDDYMGILVMSRGRPDGWRTSPGSYSMTYATDRTVTTYRTGGFIRILNDPNRKKHVGFRGINPKALATDRHLSSILLINHSSNPAYDRHVTPDSTLLRADGEQRTAVFGSIAPFGGVERDLEQLFGGDVVDFLAPFGGRGTVITTCQGVTLASIHVMRARDGSSMSIDHSRPTHTYILNGVA